MERIDPQNAADERTTLSEFLDYERQTLLLKAEGLDQEQLGRRIPTSELTLAGLVKHLALVEDNWIQVRFLGRPEADVQPWGDVDWDADWDWEFHSATADPPDELRALYAAACDRTRAVITTTDLSALSVQRDNRGQPWSLRWIVVHLIEETARHNGHADLLREAIDGEVGE
ncbi:MAG TPA: DinB family protein [Acidimicrobiales bacterium]|jgi:uncharacterized damage-inducible protein DinB|nr:DinB family protein [Acidimicrobiales bacterium]